MVLFPVAVFANLNRQPPAFNRNGVGAHGSKLLGDCVLDGINGSENTHKSHDAKGNDQHREDGTKQVGLHGNQRNLKIFYE